jgi:hypothetical protein
VECRSIAATPALKGLWTALGGSHSILWLTRFASRPDLHGRLEAILLWGYSLRFQF